MFAQVGAAAVEEVGVVAEALLQVLHEEIAHAQFGIARLECIAPSHGGELVEAVEDGVCAVFVGPKEVCEILLGTCQIVVAIPATSPCTIEVPGGHTDEIGYGFAQLVVVVEEHILAMVVRGQHQFDEEIVVHDVGLLEIAAKILLELSIAGGCCKVDGIPQRAPVNLFLLVVGVFHFVAAPTLLSVVIIIGGRLGLGEIVAARIVSHEHLIAPVR